MKIRRLLIIGVCTFAAGLTLRYGIQKFSLYGAISGHTVAVTEPMPAYTRALRPNFPYSIIPGGAYTTAELRYADQEDPVVKQHYADFNMKNAQMVQLADDKYQYASYRKKTQVYWTKKKLLIRKGEVLLTDGTSYARARCGNRLSDKPQTPVSPQEPPVEALMMPPMRLGSPMELAEKPPLGELSAIVPVDVSRLQAILPPPSGAIPTELGSLVPAGPAVPVMPAIFPAGGTPNNPAALPGSPTTPPGSSTPGSPSTPPGNPTTPPDVPPIIPPAGPPVSTVPEPNAVYLFLVTFVLSLYGLTRMMPGHEKREASHKDDGPP
jgi:hypothetical protein